VFMTHAGLGPSLDAILSFGLAAELPLTLLVGWAGAGTDHLPHHVVAGERTEAILAAADVVVAAVRPGEPVDVAAVAQRIRAARAARRTVAVLVEP
jgi:sulfopyruvate decarboxylase TPP-binding subunit